MYLKLSMVIMIVAVAGVEGRQPVLHRVGGGRNTWAPNINFSEWASHEHFYVGDWLYFGFDKSRYNVLQVNKKCYENCIDKNFISNITRGGRDVFNLTEAKTYYFLSGHGCFKGMKVEVRVRDGPHLIPPMVAIGGSPPSTRFALLDLLPLLVFYLSILVFASSFKFIEV